MSSMHSAKREPADAILVRDGDLEQLERLIAASGRRRDEAPLIALQDELDRAQVVAADDMPDDVVAMHSRVRFIDEDSGVEETLTLVYPFEAEPTGGRVSVLAPVGTALLGLRVGQSIDWQLPTGRARRLRVVAVG